MIVLPIIFIEMGIVISITPVHSEIFTFNMKAFEIYIL